MMLAVASHTPTGDFDFLTQAQGWQTHRLTLVYMVQQLRLDQTGIHNFVRGAELHHLIRVSKFALL
jgi:hypothetical protein